jgi:predicted site-specific integrase-resolvase
MKLSEYAKRNSITYTTALRMIKSGQLHHRRLPTGTIVVLDDEATVAAGYTVVYARVSSSENRDNLETQASRVGQFCSAKGWIISQVIKECGSGLNDTRPKLMKLLMDKSVTRIVVEHRDRLTRFGFNYLKTLYPGEIVVINEAANDKHDLMQDFVSLVTSFCARLYGQRRTKRNTERLISQLND